MKRPRWGIMLPLVATVIGWMSVATSSAQETDTASDTRPPNFVIVFADDLGYGDLGCYGAQGIETPRLDQMADEGLRFTSFYVAQAVCGASRAALLSGCYSNRVSLFGAPNHRARHGIHPEEMLLPEVLKQRGYATAMYGKWHLGHLPEFLPTHHGFDEYFGLPYSNDMWPYHPTNGRDYPNLPLYEGDQVIDEEVTADEQSQLTTWYTQRACAFIREKQDEPFFLYVAHNMPHVPLFVSDKHKDKSERGLYGDVIAEIDWSVGQILDTLKECGIDERTLVLFTSDNGPWLSYGNHAGTAGPLREGKGTAWEGGVRVPCVVRWPGHIPGGAECHEVAATIDVLPTFAHLAKAPLPTKPIDGHNVWPLMAGKPNARTPHQAYYYYWGPALHAVRSGKWKLHFPHPYGSLRAEPGRDGRPGPMQQKRCELALYDLESDIGETTNVASDHPEIVELLTRFADSMRADLGDRLTETAGIGVRQAGRSN